MLRTKIQENINNALKNKEIVLLQTLRFLMSAIKNKEIEAKADLSDESIIQIIKKQVKELGDAKEMFAKAGREELAAANGEQIAILTAYLPEEIGDDELKKEVERVISENKEQYEKNPRSLMGIAVNQLKAKADPQRIVRILQEIQN